MLRNNCHPRKVITYAIVYTHNRLWMHILRGGEENPACTLGVCALYCVRMPQIAFELLPITVDFPDVCVCVWERERGGRGRVQEWGRGLSVEGCWLSWNGSDLLFLNFLLNRNIFWIWFIYLGLLKRTFLPAWHMLINEFSYFFSSRAVYFVEIQSESLSPQRPPKCPGFDHRFKYTKRSAKKVASAFPLTALSGKT